MRISVINIINSKLYLTIQCSKFRFHLGVIYIYVLFTKHNLEKTCFIQEYR